jgi:hypothetical protein
MSNQVIQRKLNGQFAKGVSGNLGGNAQRTRHIFNKAFLEALAKDFQEGGAQAIAKVRKEQPAAYMKICALLIPREHKVEHSNPLKDLTDEQLEAMIEYIETSLAAQAGRSVKLIEGTIEPTAVEVTAPTALEPPKPKSRLMLAADAAVRPSERKQRKVPSPPDG